MYRKLAVLLMLLPLCSLVSAAANPQLEAALTTFQTAQSNADYSRALEQFKKLHKDHPEDAEISFYLGRSLYLERDLEAADEVLSDNIQRHPNHAESHYVIGSVKLARVAEVNIFRKTGMAKQAISAWEKTVELEPGHEEALFGVAEFYLNAPSIAGGDKEKGKQILSELEALSEPWASITKASLALKEESYAEAERYLDVAIKGVPHRAFPQLMLANAYMKQEKFAEALDAIETYKMRKRTWNDPGPAQTELMAAKILSGLGKKEAAMQSIEVVLASNPSKALKEQANEVLEQLAR